VGPEKLRFHEMRELVIKEGVTEVLIAVSTDMDGDATAGYIVEVLKDTPSRVTRLAFGLPAGSAVAYSDPLTLRRAVRGRMDA
jgi:recombination protein RecR